MSNRPVQNNLLLNHYWDRDNRYTFSSVSDFHEFGKDKTKYTGLKYVLSGEEQYKIQNTSHKVKKGSCLVVNEDRIVDTHVMKFPDAVEGICISLDNKLLNDIFLNSILTDEKLADNGPLTHSDEFHFCETVYDAGDILCKHLESLSAFQNKHTGRISLPHEEIFYGIARHLLISQSLVKKQSLRINALRPVTRFELYKRINLARQKIQDEPEADISMAALAAEVCMSEFHFFRVFKEAIGMSPNQYRIKVKIEKAKELLLHTKMPLHEIAFVTGFTDVQNLSKVFKKYFSMPPGKYRRG